MADNQSVLTGDAGTAFTVATDEISGAHYQKVKLYDPTADSTSGIGILTKPLRVGAGRKRVQAASSGLTTATTAYSVGDTVGAGYAIAGAANATGGTGIIRAISLLDKADIMTDARIWIFRFTVTLAADNAAFSVSDSDMENYFIAHQSLGAAVDAGANRVLHSNGLSIPYDCTGTALFIALETRTAHTFYGAATDLPLTVYLDLD